MPAAVVDGTSVLHKSHDRQIRLFTIPKFGKIYLDPKNKRVAFLRCSLNILCENTRVPSAVQIFVFLHGGMCVKALTSYKTANHRF